MAAAFTACILYGDARAPSGFDKYEFDRVLTQRDDLRERLRQLQGHLVIARVRNWIDKPAQLEILHDPSFEPKQSLVVNARFVPITIKDFNATVDVVLDRFSEQSGYQKPFIRVPKINETAVQVYGTDKYLAFRDILQPLGLAIPTVAPDNVEALVAEFGATSAYFAKLRRGGFGRGLEGFASAAELVSWLGGLAAEERKRYIIQPAYDFLSPIPGLRPFTSNDDKAVAANWQPVSKEVRLYCFARNGKCQEQFALPRANQFAAERSYKGVDSTWMWADPSSVPSEPYVMSKQVIERIAAQTGEQVVYGAIDFGYGIAPNSKTPQWVVIECNLDFPGVRTPRQHPIIGGQVSDMLARHIAAVARA